MKGYRPICLLQKLARMTEFPETARNPENASYGDDIGLYFVVCANTVWLAKSTQSSPVNGFRSNWFSFGLKCLSEELKAIEQILRFCMISNKKFEELND
ncbi:hypothetical protein OUZ56_029887 [Daphnia magna]|uniref:Uncharacterized protein n=1 Tax=Daphnia magna TaxID=35525 RepID=A0ABR0B858_9CRUS|nr:hypothetical protein OUZ56_029887 [Daphnia magna]